MKPLKMLGLAALAALTAMAFVGVTSAMAANTALCKVDENPCAAANQIKHVHEETAAGAPALLLTGELGTVECKVLFLGTVLALAAPQVIHGNFTYTECKRGEENCTVKEVSADSLLDVLRTVDELAEVTGKGEVEVVCGLFIKCVYTGEKLVGHGLGALTAGPNGETRLEEKEVNKKEGVFVCPLTAKLDILTKPLVATYIKA